MKTKALTAAQIDTLAQRLSETQIEPSASAKKAGDNFARLLAARIGAERAALAFSSIMTAETSDQAEARLTLVLDYGNPDPAGEPITAADEEPKAAPAPVVGKRKAILDQAQTGALPQAPDFSKPTNSRFRAKLAQIISLAEAGDIAGLQAFEINPVSSSPKAVARYRDLCVMALKVRAEAKARRCPLSSALRSICGLAAPGEKRLCPDQPVRIGRSASLSLRMKVKKAEMRGVWRWSGWVRMRQARVSSGIGPSSRTRSGSASPRDMGRGATPTPALAA